MESFYALNTKIVKKIPSGYAQENMDFVKLLSYGECLTCGILVPSF